MLAAAERHALDHVEAAHPRDVHGQAITSTHAQGPLTTFVSMRQSFLKLWRILPMDLTTNPEPPHHLQSSRSPPHPCARIESRLCAQRNPVGGVPARGRARPGGERRLALGERAAAVMLAALSWRTQ
ncbi:hypothetical protein MESS4_p20006 [Mesorhizobium sp. STM 4661]|nr:hypothetical protein MESS4_p20006 [Mesorhizobium sp. STM 4661]